MKVVVTNYTGDRRNWGCQATSRELLRFLTEVLPGHASSRLETISLPTRHEFDVHLERGHGRRFREIYADPKPYGSALDFVETFTRMRFGPHYKKLLEADVVFFQGEGSIGPDDMLRGVRLFALPFLAAHKYRKPVISLNQSLYATSDADARSLRAIFGAFDVVAVREAVSYQFARRIGLDHAILCPDFAFRHKPSGQPPVDLPVEGFFCVSGSAIGGDAVLEPLTRVVRRTQAVHGLRPVFIGALKADVTRLRSMAIDQAKPVVMTSAELPSSGHLAAVLARARFVIGGRYHSAITALAQGTPAILLPGNTYKNEGLGPMLDLPLEVFGAGDESAVETRIDDILNGTVLSREQILESLERIERHTALFEDYLGALLASLSGERPRPVPSDEITPKDLADIDVSKHQALYRASNQQSPGDLPFVQRLRLWMMCRSAKLPESLASTFKSNA